MGLVEGTDKHSQGSNQDSYGLDCVLYLLERFSVVIVGVCLESVFRVLTYMYIALDESSYI